MKLYFNSKQSVEVPAAITPCKFLRKLGIPSEQYYLISNGKLIDKTTTSLDITDAHVVFKTFGGKGGFGSMLRAIGAQIEKTTNREACRDLSGRRLRDINEEQRLKNWIATQAEREKEAAERKKKKLERLCEMPKHEFKDETYDELRSQLPEKVEDAVTQGLKASASGKRKHEEVKGKGKQKKKKLWIDEDLSGVSSDESDEGTEDETSKEVPESATKLSSEEDKNSKEAPEQSQDEFNDKEACTSISNAVVKD